ncbi:glycosyltransferase WbuB [Brumimicrobium salinarum]|uniref:Glycosyltransferase WbuB n=1 Tax=Brumimicrobium salinarum TaxID=2058658 RepID=A0A2I0R163_9FLAO|nr:glycosyltransferase family 4 protein [Brumimicrobium salinarum]PKR80295.1 glycosyltransferase WbuB [Brumimicrobium salinarum]
MNLLYIHQYFVTPSESGGTRSYWLAKELINRGHEVTMITSSIDISKKIERKKIDGINVIYIKEDYQQSMSIRQRLKAFLSFMFKASRLAMKQKDIDLVIATSTPLTVGVPALILKWFKGIPYVFEVRDLWPEVPIQMGAIRNKLLIRIMRRFEKSIYKNAKHIIALSPGMLEGVLKYVPKEKTTMIPNMSKIDEFWPRDKNLELEKSLGLKQESFKIIHFGAIGLANGVHTIIESAKLLNSDKTVEFIFVGGGAIKEQLINKCKDLGLSNVKFLGKFPMQETSEIVNLCDVSMVSFLDLPILYTNSPNKLFDSLSAGKPIIVNSSGWTKEIVEKNNCGFYVDPNRPKELVNKIRLLQNDTALIKQMGENARNLAKNKYDKGLLCKQFADTIEKHV